ncbi:hypothetical protein ACHAWF_000474 [Thalassiosira exigua]
MLLSLREGHLEWQQFALLRLHGYQQHRRRRRFRHASSTGIYLLFTRCAAEWTTNTNSACPGSSICTHAPDYECYQTGWPPCCSENNGDDCPSFQTMCNNQGEGETGSSYCTYAPDYQCWHMGHPDCCSAPGGEYMNCPKEQPPCDDSGNADDSSATAVKYLRTA